VPNKITNAKYNTNVLFLIEKNILQVANFDIRPLKTNELKKNSVAIL